MFTSDESNHAGTFEHVAEMSRGDQPRPHRKTRSSVHPLVLPPLVQSPLVNERLRQSAEEEKQVWKDETIME